MRVVWAVLTGLLILLLPTTALAQEEGEEDPTVVQGSIQQEVEEGEVVGVEGVELAVETADGEEVETVTTDADGQYRVELPGGGDYTVTLNVETLPEGAELRNPDNNPLEFDVVTGETQFLLFPIGEGERRVGGELGAALQLLVEGIKLGLIIAITSIGLSLVFGTTGLVNFAHGELVSFGAIIAYFFNVSLGINLIPATLLAIIVGGAVGAALDGGLWRPLRRRGTGIIAALVVSVGLSILWRYGLLYQFGGRTRPYAQYAVQSAIPIGPISITPKDMVSVLLSVVVLIAVGLMLQRTKVGKAMRAVADNRDLAESSGINVQRVIMFVWILAGALATLGGVLYGLAEQVSWQMGFLLLLLMFAGVILGGLGTAYGALIGSLIIGIFVQMWTLFFPAELNNVGAFGILIIILLVRPQGIMGHKERIG